jgi:hypothetical protein
MQCPVPICGVCYKMVCIAVKCLMTLFSRMMTSDVCCSQYYACLSRECVIMSILNVKKCFEQILHAL